MAVLKVIDSKASIGIAINYVSKEEKTQGKKLLAGDLCDPENALVQMQVVKQMWGKTGGREYKHLVMSYPPGENITPEQAIENARKLMEGTKRMKGHQILYACHVDRGHLHVHIIINSVNIETGDKIRWPKHTLEKMKERCNELTRSQGLSVPEKTNSITDWTHGEHQMLERAAKGKYKSYVYDMACAVIDAKENAVSKEEFIRILEDQGIKTTWEDDRKYITFVDPEGNKVRNSNLEKTFKIPLGKEDLINDFSRNQEKQQSVSINTRRAAAAIESANRTSGEVDQAIDDTIPMPAGYGSGKGSAADKERRTGIQELRADQDKRDAAERSAREERENREAIQRGLRDAERREAEEAERKEREAAERKEAEPRSQGTEIEGSNIDSGTEDIDI